MLQQQVDGLDGRTREQLQLVEHQQARVRVQLDRTGQHAQFLLARRRRPGVIVVQRGKVGISLKLNTDLGERER